jgi:hypothetical protein
MRASLQLDRREFLGHMILAIGGASIAAMIPFTPADATTPAQPGDWSIDDMCGAYPPYSHPIPFGRPQAVSDRLMAHADPADHIFLI